MIRLLTAGFGKVMIFALLGLVATNAFLCYSGKQLQAENQAKQTEIALVRANNQNLANQLELAQTHAEQYRRQINQLHNQVLDKLNQAEERTNALLNEIDKHQSWANQPLPDSVSRLLNQRADRQNHQTTDTAMPTKPAVPIAKPPPTK